MLERQQEPTRCTKCLLPETFPDISFDVHGVCSYCSRQQPVSVLGEANLGEVLQSRKGKVYDCVVPLSGGKDSTYMLWYAVEVLALRAIAVNYDSGFQATLAAENMRNVCSQLNVPLVIKSAKRSTQLNMLRQVLQISEILGMFFGTCMNCEVNIRTVAINTAREHAVPFILYGSSRMEDIGIHTFMGPRAMLRRIPPRKVLSLAGHVARYCLYDIRQRAEMQVPLPWRFLPLSAVPFPERGATVMHFFDYIEWDSMRMIGFLQDRLGWRAPTDQDQRFDCSLHCLGNYKWLQESGISSDGFTYANMVRQGKLSREEALRKEALVESTLEEECRSVLQAVGMGDHALPRGGARSGIA